MNGTLMLETSTQVSPSAAVVCWFAKRTIFPILAMEVITSLDLFVIFSDIASVL
jgi:hypothetical protein